MATLDDLSDEYPELLTIAGHDNAIAGWSLVDGVERLVYNGEAIVQNLILSGMTWEEAREWYAFNIESAYLGPRTPLLLNEVEVAGAEELSRLSEG